MSMFIYKGGGGVKNGQNFVYVIKVWPLILVYSNSKHTVWEIIDFYRTFGVSKRGTI